MHRTTLRRLEYFLLIAGFLCLAYVGSTTGRAYFYQSYENYKFNQTIKGQPATLEGYLRNLFEKTPEAPKVAGPTVEPPKESIPDADPGLVGRVEIPRLKISVIVREGADEDTLESAVGHVPHTALPGARGNVGIAAHRDTYFRNVRNIRKGDVIRMVTTKATYEYAVESMKIVKPSQVEVLDPTPQPALTPL